MTDARNELLLSALRRATTPLTSGDVLDAAMGLAEAEGWTPAQLASLSRKAVSKRLQNLADAGVVGLGQSVLDGDARLHDSAPGHRREEGDFAAVLE